MTGIKHDQAKMKWAYAPWRGFEAILEVMHFGAKKYGWNNWREGLEADRLWSATFRHLFEWLMGEENDSESGLSHLAHAACCIIFLFEGVSDGSGLDNRSETRGEKVDSGHSDAATGGKNDYIFYGGRGPCASASRTRESSGNLRPFPNRDDDQADGHKG